MQATTTPPSATHVPPNLSHVVEEALDAFWDIVIDRFPPAATEGASVMTEVLDTAAYRAVEEWVMGNAPAANS